MFSRILYATDGSAASKIALKYAIDIARTYGAEVIIAHAYEPIPALIGSPFYEKMLEPQLVAGERLLQQLALMFEEEGVEVHHEMLGGPVAEAILNVTEAHNYDLIIMGARGLGETGSLLLGSASHEVIHKAHCPVLMVR